MKIALLALSALAISPFASLSAHASVTTSATINGTDAVYNTGSNTINSGTVATGIAVLPGTTYFTFSASSIGAGVTVNIGSGSNYAGPDGGSYSGETVYSSGSLSGIDAPTAGFIAGVFVPAGGPSGVAPATLNFDGTGATDFTSLSPLLDQVFFIGDGLDGTATQTFFTPTGAGELYIGLADACGFNDPPSCYNDNGGSFAFTATQDGAPGSVSATPEPSSLVLLGTGLLSACGAVRRRFVR